jgi:hypothetical protein
MGPVASWIFILVKKGKHIKLSISVKNDRKLQYSFENFGGDYTFTNLNEIRHYNHMFRNFKNELEIAETISVPSLLEFDNAENVIYLRGKVLEKYPYLLNSHNTPAPI